MTLRIDPEQNETRELKQAANWKGQHVLEIGCGDGRLSRRLARLGSQVHAIDPDAEMIRVARQRLPKSFASRVHFDVGKAGRLEYSRGTFDLIVFSWVL